MKKIIKDIFTPTFYLLVLCCMSIEAARQFKNEYVSSLSILFIIFITCVISNEIQGDKK